MDLPVYLNKLIQAKTKRLSKDKKEIEEVMNKISNWKDRPSFYDSMNKKGLSIIGEIKKASPSKGIIRQNFNVKVLVEEYQDSVDAISVLTEEDFFLGCDQYLEEVSRKTTLPTLCKDFIIDEYQIYKAKALGASCILLIVSILSEKQLREFTQLAKNLSMDVLVEVHSREEIEIALNAGALIIGINNRDLHTFKTDIITTMNLRKYIPNSIKVISESGIKSKEDIKKLKSVSIDGILVGESFMTSNNILKTSKEFRRAYAT